MSNLRGYQVKLKEDINAAFAAGARAVMAQSGTGTGKTVVIGSLAKDHMVSPWNPSYPGGGAIAHRKELVIQLSMQLAREDVPHDIIAPQSLIREAVEQQIEELGRTYYHSRAVWRVASVDTINRRQGLDAWFESVGMLFIDEAHHVLADNKWGKCVNLFPHSRAVLPTATPIRADGKGLGRDSHGIADALVEAPPMRWMIQNGYLTNYKVFTIQPKDLNLDAVSIGASGEFNPEQLREAVHNSQSIVGDVVDTYIKYAMGKLGVTFAVDIEHGKEITAEFNRRGVPAILLTSESTNAERRNALRAFKNRSILQLVNIDLFGEGFDLPAIECVSFARPTASFALYSQQWGRALRLMISKLLMAAWDSYSVQSRLRYIAESEKPFAYIFDHCGNFYRHNGPPDRPRVWSLAPRGRSKAINDGIPMRTCLNVATCGLPYERIYPACPYCGTSPPAAAQRGGALTVDGDITEIDPDLFAKYMGEIARVDMPSSQVIAPAGVERVFVVAQHQRRQAAQHKLRDAITAWASSYRDEARVTMRRFWFTFGIDVLQAKTLGAGDAAKLMEKIYADLRNRGIVAGTNVINETMS